MEQQDYSPWLEDATKQFITEGHEPKPRVIVAAANLHSKIPGLVLVGARHFSPAMQMQLDVAETYWSDIKTGEFLQGFIDQYDQFVDRKEALRICRANGQKLIHEEVITDELFSENLY